MDAVETIGLVKMDILAQGGLAAMRDVKHSLSRRGIEIDLEGLEPWQNPRVWEMIAGGGARAVHHIESPAMTSLCRMCNVSEIDGLVAIVSVIRLGRQRRQETGLHPALSRHGTDNVSSPVSGKCLRSTMA